MELQLREYRPVGEDGRMFSAMYAMKHSPMNNYGLTPSQFFAGHFAGLFKIAEHEFISCMRSAGKALLILGIDCRTSAEIVRSKMQQIVRHDEEVI